jgi:hypothetical protein
MELDLSEYKFFLLPDGTRGKKYKSTEYIEGT